MTLLDSVHWKASEHPRVSRGYLAGGSGFLAGNRTPVSPILFEDCQVMTRKQHRFFLNVSRTTVFDEPEVPDKGAILFWKTSDEQLLRELHNTCVSICAEVGFTEFCTMAAARGPSAPPYWREMLGDQYRYLRKRL
jgi:hypothetical protein